MWGVVAVTVATFTVLLAVRRFLMVGSQFVFSRYVAVGGLVALSADREKTCDPDDSSLHRVRFEVGGPGVFHNVTVQLLGVPESFELAEVERPAIRHTMAAGDRPIEWTFRLPTMRNRRTASSTVNVATVTATTPHIRSTRTECQSLTISRVTTLATVSAGAIAPDNPRRRAARHR